MRLTCINGPKCHHMRHCLGFDEKLIKQRDKEEKVSKAKKERKSKNRLMKRERKKCKQLLVSIFG